MASTTILSQSKLRKLLIDGEAVSGTYETPDSSSLIVPVIGFPTLSMDRGKQMIDRVATTDGQAGAVASIRGSSAWSGGMEMELHDSGTKYNYWTLFMLACGFELTNVADVPSSGDVSAVLSLSNKYFASYSGVNVSSDPITLSATVIQNRNQVQDYAMRMRGVTGVASFNLATGDIAKMSVASKGLVVTAFQDADDFLDNDETDVSQFGTTSDWAVPFVVKNVTMLINDAEETAREVCVQSIGINMNSNHPDFECPSDEYGFEISPVFHDASPTVDLTFPDGETVQPWVFAQLRSGATFSLTAVLKSSVGRDLIFTFPKLQFQTVTLGDSGGFVNYTVNCKAVRDPGTTAENIMQVIYVYSPDF